MSEDHARHERPCLPLSAKLGWALGQLPIASHVGVVSFYLLYFVTDVHGIPPVWAGLVLLLPRIFNIVFDPVVGSLSDRLRSRYGRRRPFVLFGSMVWGAAFALLFALPVDATPTRGIVALFAAFMAVSAGQTLYHVPYSAMLAEMTQDARERISMASWKEGVSRIGILIAASTTPIVVSFYPSEAAGYRAAGMIFGAVVMGGGLVAFFATTGAPVSGPSEHRIPWREQLAAMLSNAPFCRLVSAYILIMVADEIFSSSLIFYAVNVLGQKADFVAKAYPVSSIAAILTIAAWNWLAGRVGKRRALAIALAGMMGTWASVLLIPAAHAWLMLPLMGVAGIFNAGLLMLPNAMVADTVEYDAANVGQRREGAIYGAWVFCQQSAMAGGGFILSMALGLIGYHADGAQSEAVLTGLTIIIAVLPVVLLAIAMVLMRRYPLTEQRVDELVRAQAEMNPA